MRYYWVYVSGRWYLHGAGGYLDVVAYWADAGCAVLVLPSTSAHGAGRHAVADLVPVRYREARRADLPVTAFDDAPAELQVAITEFWPPDEWINAAQVAKLESGWDAFAVNDTRRPDAPCGTTIEVRNGVPIAAEYSIGYYQINSCNFPQWEPQRFYNARHNAGTAHLLWDRAGGRWTPWFYTARDLGLA
jgi:hypothetical protein